MRGVGVVLGWIVLRPTSRRDRLFDQEMPHEAYSPIAMRMVKKMRCAMVQTFYANMRECVFVHVYIHTHARV